MNQAVNRWSVRTLAVGLLGVVGLAQIPAAAAATYQLQTLGDVGVGWDMNNAGLVVGSQYESAVPVTWLGGTTTFLPQGSVAPIYAATGVSQNGYIVGAQFLGDKGVRWQGSSITVLSPIPNAEVVWALGVNNSGIAVGATAIDYFADVYRATLWNVDGVPSVLSSLTSNGTAVAFDINNDGLVVGSSYAGGQPQPRGAVVPGCAHGLVEPRCGHLG